MNETVKKARIAGAAYLLMMTAPFSLVYIPARLIVRGNAAATAERVLAHETMFRLGIVNELYVATASIVVLLALFRLFHQVDRTLSWLMVILGSIVSVPIMYLNVLNEIAALLLFRGTDYLTVFDKPQREALGMLFLRLHGQGITVVAIFWGLWLLPLGVLVIRSRFIPRILGVLLIINGFAYVVASVASLLASPYASVISRWAVIPETGELWILLWLLIKGAKVEPSSPAVSHS